VLAGICVVGAILMALTRPPAPRRVPA